MSHSGEGVAQGLPDGPGDGLSDLGGTVESDSPESTSISDSKLHSSPLSSTRPGYAQSSTVVYTKELSVPRGRWCTCA